MRPGRRPEPAVRRTRFSGGAEFHRLWAAVTVSELGSHVGLIATTVVAIEVLDAGALQVGALNAGRTVPVLLLALPVGVLVDRVARQPLLARADAVRALLALTVPVAALAGVLTYTQLLVVVLLTAGLGVCFDLAQHSLLPGIVAGHDLESANLRLISSRAAAGLVGRGLAAALVATIGAAATVTVDALTYAFSASMCGAITRDAPPARAPGVRATARIEVVEGLRFVLRHPTLRPLTAGAALTNLAAAMVEVLLPLLVLRGLGHSPSALAAVLMVGAAGFTVGATIGRRASRRWGVRTTLVGATGCHATAYALLATATTGGSLPQLVVAVLLVGMATPAFNLAHVTVRQSSTPPRLLGRMTASVRSVTWTAAGVGSLVAGLAAGTLGCHLALLLAAGVATGGALLLLASPVRQLGRRSLPLWAGSP